MSVYTPITHSQLTKFLSAYSLGELLEFHGIEEGIENTNYHLQTTSGDYILTLFEELKAEELPFFLELLNHLAEKQIPCPQAQENQKGEILQKIAKKPAVLFNYLLGSSKSEPTIEDCKNIGQQLALLHIASSSFSEKRNNEMELKWCKKTFNTLKKHLAKQDCDLIQQQLDFQALFPMEKLPQGIIHADLFKDNVLFEGEKITGLLDFYQACNDSLLLDLAITVNDWCQQQGEFNYFKAEALINAYQEQRPLTSLEKQSWSSVLQIAALRFWLLRLEFQHTPKPSVLSATRDPEVYKRLLIQHLSLQIRL